MPDAAAVTATAVAGEACGVGGASGQVAFSRNPAEERANIASLLKQRRYVSLSTVERAIFPMLQKWHTQPAMATHLLTRLRQARRALTAWQVLQVMRCNAVETNVIHYSSVIIACENQGAWQLALDLLSSMDSSRIKHDVISMSSAISACEKASWQKFRNRNAAVAMFDAFDMHCPP